MNIDFSKNNGLVPAVVQDAQTGKVLMLGYMNEEALAKTKADGKVTFFSRSKKRLWTKGESSGNELFLQDIRTDCDNDTLLVKATPSGPVCHTGSDTCFNELNTARSPEHEAPTNAKPEAGHSPDLHFLTRLQAIIRDRKANPSPSSYTSSLLKDGIGKIAQKVGEEAVEVVIEAMAGHDDKLKEEAADLLYHLLVLFEHKGIELEEVVAVLAGRHRSA